MICETGSFPIINPLVRLAEHLARRGPFLLTDGDKAGKPVMLYLTVIVSPNPTSYPILPINASNPQSTEVNEASLRETTSSLDQDSTNATRSTVATGSEALPLLTYHLPSTPMPAATDGAAGISPSENALRDALTTTPNTTRFTVTASSDTLSPPTDHLPSEMSALMPPVMGRWAGMSPAENALHDAEEVMATINLSKTWEDALWRIKWVMDTVSPVAEVRYNVLFANP